MAAELTVHDDDSIDEAALSPSSSLLARFHSPVNRNTKDNRTSDQCHFDANCTFQPTFIASKNRSKVYSAASSVRKEFLKRGNPTILNYIQQFPDEIPEETQEGSLEDHLEENLEENVEGNLVEDLEVDLGLNLNEYLGKNLEVTLEKTIDQRVEDNLVTPEGDPEQDSGQDHVDEEHEEKSELAHDRLIRGELRGESYGASSEEVTDDSPQYNLGNDITINIDEIAVPSKRWSDIYVQPQVLENAEAMIGVERLIQLQRGAVTEFNAILEEITSSNSNAAEAKSNPNCNTNSDADCGNQTLELPLECDGCGDCSNEKEELSLDCRDQKLELSLDFEDLLESLNLIELALSPVKDTRGVLFSDQSNEILCDQSKEILYTENTIDNTIPPATSAVISVIPAAVSPADFLVQDSDLIVCDNNDDSLQSKISESFKINTRRTEKTAARKKLKEKLKDHSNDISIRPEFDKCLQFMKTARDKREEIHLINKSLEMRYYEPVCEKKRGKDGLDDLIEKDFLFPSDIRNNSKEKSYRKSSVATSEVPEIKSTSSSLIILPSLTPVIAWDNSYLPSRNATGNNGSNNGSKSSTSRPRSSQSNLQSNPCPQSCQSSRSNLQSNLCPQSSQSNLQSTPLTPTHCKSPLFPPNTPNAFHSIPSAKTTGSTFSTPSTPAPSTSSKHIGNSNSMINGNSTLSTPTKHMVNSIISGSNNNMHMRSYESSSPIHPISSFHIHDIDNQHPGQYPGASYHRDSNNNNADNNDRYNITEETSSKEEKGENSSITKSIFLTPRHPTKTPNKTPNKSNLSQPSGQFRGIRKSHQKLMGKYQDILGIDLAAFDGTLDSFKTITDLKS